MLKINSVLIVLRNTVVIENLENTLKKAKKIVFLTVAKI